MPGSAGCRHGHGFEDLVRVLFPASTTQDTIPTVAGSLAIRGAARSRGRAPPRGGTRRTASAPPHPPYRGGGGCGGKQKVNNGGVFQSSPFLG